MVDNWPWTGILALPTLQGRHQPEGTLSSRWFVAPKCGRLEYPSPVLAHLNGSDGESNATLFVDVEKTVVSLKHVLKRIPKCSVAFG